MGRNRDSAATPEVRHGRAARGAGGQPGPVRVLIVDDHAVVRRGIRAYLEVLDGIEVVAEAGDGQEALDRLAAMAAHREEPDVVLLDLLMPGLDGIGVISRVTQGFPGVRVVVLTSFGETERVHAALAGGAAGYLLKSAGPDEVVAAIRAAARGEVFLDPSVARRLTRELVSPRTGLGALTDRERDVLMLLAGGRSNREIAAELVISERTARTHVSNVLRKLGLSSRTQAALVAVREGLVPPQG
ncbi:response regulator transcription factor [Amycolatopsis sacchari]|uniref:response regulator transcription factor n=1 Tax=Amycolatopsis sacchari TaxID=115433 RepID=UPI003EBF4567